MRKSIVARYECVVCDAEAPCTFRIVDGDKPEVCPLNAGEKADWLLVEAHKYEEAEE